MRMRRKPNLEARLEKCAHLLVKEPELLRGRWLDEYPYGKLCLELGCGKGRFTVETAKTEPDVLYVALEKSANVMVIALERTVAEDPGNVRFINALADNLPDYFAPGEVSGLFINFCDPWPSNRHAKRRLTGRRFLEIFAQVLRPDGEIHFRTDNLPLFEFSLHEFESCGFSLLESSRDAHKGGSAGIMTDYELKFHSQGIPIYKCVARLTNRLFT